MLFGVSGKSLSMNLVADGIWMRTFGSLDWSLVLLVPGKKSDVCSMSMVSPFALRGLGATILVGDFVCFCAPVLAELPELPLRW